MVSEEADIFVLGIEIEITIINRQGPLKNSILGLPYLLLDYRGNFEAGFSKVFISITRKYRKNGKERK
jgi:hypothetical protein